MTDFNPNIDLGGSQDPPVANEDQGLANPFLSNIPDPDKAVVAKYIKDWDAGVTKKFQELHGKYKPYEELGDYDTLSQSMRLWQALDNDPVQTYKFIEQTLREAGLLSDTGNMQQEVSNLPEFEGVPTQFVQEFQSMKQQLESLNNNFQQSTQQMQEKEEMQMLDNLLKEMHTKHGNFDEDYVLLQLSRGSSPEDAVKAYKDFIDREVNSRMAPKRPAPPLLGGAGGIPTGQVDRSNMTPKDRRALIASVLESANQ